MHVPARAHLFGIAGLLIAAAVRGSVAVSVGEQAGRSLIRHEGFRRPPARTAEPEGRVLAAVTSDARLGPVGADAAREPTADAGAANASTSPEEDMLPENAWGDSLADQDPAQSPANSSGDLGANSSAGNLTTDTARVARLTVQLVNFSWATALPVGEGYVGGWSEYFTTSSLQGLSAYAAGPADKVQCLGKYCVDMRLHFVNRSMDPYSGVWTRWFSQQDPAEAMCPNKHAVTRMQCKSTDCSDIRLYCQETNRSQWLVDDSATEEKAWFNEYEGGMSQCKEGNVLYGMRCGGQYCDSKQLLCKGIKFPPFDCAWNAWSDWSVCGATCGDGWQTRLRTKQKEQHGGHACLGKDAGSQKCNSDPCPLPPDFPQD